MQENEYEVSISVTGYFRVRVKANSEDEARINASDQCSEADFGPLEDIDWEEGKVTKEG